MSEDIMIKRGCFNYHDHDFVLSKKALLLENAEIKFICSICGYKQGVTYTTPKSIETYEQIEERFKKEDL